MVPLQSVAIPETVLSVDSLLLCHYKQVVIQPVHVSLPVPGTRAACSSSAGGTLTITVGCPLVEGHSVH